MSDDTQAILTLHDQLEKAQLAALADDTHEPFEVESEPAGLLAPAAPDHVAELLAIAHDPRRFALAQATARRKLPGYPHNGCADFQSVLLQMAGFGTPWQPLARELGLYLEAHGWKSVPVGQQKAGDLGSTCGAAPHPGVDHIYLVMHVGQNGEMTIADNQRSSPHERWTVGHGKSPTTHFLRYVG